jgi:hypothetical protein
VVNVAPRGAITQPLRFRNNDRDRDPREALDPLQMVQGVGLISNRGCPSAATRDQPP